MKKLIMALMLLPLMTLADPDTEIVNGIEWRFTISEGKAIVQGGERALEEMVGAIEIPSTLGGCPVTSIGRAAFIFCDGLTSVSIPEGVTSIEENAFCCSGLTSVTLPLSVMSIGSDAFSGCSGLKSVTMLEGVKSIGYAAFSGCNGLTSVTIPSNVTSVGASAFGACSGLKSVTILRGVKGIDVKAFLDCRSISSVTIPANFKVEDVFPDSKDTITDVTILGDGSALRDYAWQGCRLLEFVTFDGPISEIGESAFENCRHLESITIPATVKKIDAYAFYGCGRLTTVNYLGEKPESGGAAFMATGVEQSPAADVVNVVVSNVIVQYVFNSEQPEFAIPATSDAGFVNIITEVKGGAVAVPATWVGEYPNFVGKYGSDFTKALTMKTGKKDGAGNEMLVWQDYVAGTDPTKVDDVFTASITIVDGKVTISYTPELDDARKAMRKYTTWGKTSLMDTDWTEVQKGREAEYNFFKVSVEMR